MKTILIAGSCLLGILLASGVDVMANTYEVIPGPFDWAEAKVDAETRGGYLGTITSAEEWLEIQRQLGLPIPFFDPSPSDDPGTIVGVWLGATDLETEGEWKWITGEPWSFTNWDPVWNEPSGAGIYGEEDFLAMYGGDGTWNDGTGWYLRHWAPIGYLLEKEATAVPESGHYGLVAAGTIGLLFFLDKRRRARG